MAGAGVRWLQCGLWFVVLIMTICVCCSAPVARDLNFLSKTGSSKAATNPTSGFNSLQMGLTGYCNKGKCASYREFTADVRKASVKTAIDAKERKAIYVMAGKGSSVSNKTWLRLSILFGASAAVAFFSCVLAFFLAKGASAGGYDDYGGGGGGVETPLLKTMRIIFLGFTFITFVMLLSAFAISHMEFNKAKDTLIENREKGSYGNAWYLSLAAFILAFCIAALEGVAIAVQRGGGQGGGGGAYQDYGGGDGYR